MRKKFLNLVNNLKKMDSVIIAFSGGVDSTFLLYSLTKALPLERIYPVIVKSPFLPKNEYEEAVSLAKQLQVNLTTLYINTLLDEKISQNSPQRCYFCKKNIFTKIIEESQKYKVKYVLDGSNADDLDDYRPGLKALQELKIKSPLLEVGLNKKEIRALSKEFKLPTWNKPALACLASRIPYGNRLTLKNLSEVERAENILREYGFREFRVRHHDTIARIELLPEEWYKVFENKLYNEITHKFKEIGFKYTTLDLRGYIQGSLNI